MLEKRFKILSRIIIDVRGKKFLDFVFKIKYLDLRLYLLLQFYREYYHHYYLQEILNMNIEIF
jgi:hypothetical protein